MSKNRFLANCILIHEMKLSFITSENEVKYSLHEKPVIQTLPLASLFCYLFNVSVSCSVMSDSLWFHGLSPPGFSFHGILQTKILEWVAVPFFRDLLDPGIKTRSSVLLADSLPSEPPGKPMVAYRLTEKKKGIYSILFIKH